MPRTVLTPPAGGSPMPDVPNWAWHEYGNRVGFWRMLEVFDRLQIPVVLAINGGAIQAYEPIARAALERRWEFIGHGFGQKNMQKVPDERADIQKTTTAIKSFTGRRPRGWLGPGLTETWETPDILADEGYEYVCDWVLDDQPVPCGPNWLAGERALYAGVQRRRDDAHSAPHGAEYRDRAIDQFDQLYSDARIQRASWPRRPSLHHGRSTSAALFPRSACPHSVPSGRGVLDGRTDSGVVPCRVRLRLIGAARLRGWTLRSVAMTGDR